MKLLKNKEVQLSIGVVILLILVFSIVLMNIVKSFTNDINAIQIKQNIAVIGSIVKKYPQQETEIVKNYTKGFDENYEYGKSILEKYSYNEGLNAEKITLLEKNINHSYRTIKITIAVFALLLIIIFILILNNIYQRIRYISVQAEAAVEGQYESIEGDSKEGDLGYLIYQFNCMTERLNENVQTLNNEKLFLKRLITDISHQLKTPLASLIMFNDIMKNDNDLSEEDRNTFVTESKNQLDRMEWLIKNMLKMAKLEAGIVELDIHEAPIADTIKYSLEPLKVIAAEKNVSIKVTGDNKLMVKHDINWTTEALSNIIKNCIEHSYENTEVCISWEENNVFVQIVIDDNGPGIPKAELPKIFDRFYKGPNSCSPTNIGIGLYISKTIIEAHGGSVYVHSTEGKGTKFVLRLMKLT